MKSMTGFGRAVYETDMVRVTAEVKSVNNRFLECGIYLPKGYAILEDPLRKQLSRHFARGKMTLNCTIQEIGVQEKNVVVDESLFQAYQEALEQLSQKHYGKSVCLRDVMACSKDWISAEEAERDMDKIGSAVSQAVEEACREMTAMRSIEGENLKRDILSRIRFMETVVSSIESRSPEILRAYEVRLTERMEELMQRFGLESDRARLLQEIAVFADKTDITEEIVRLRSHFQQFIHAAETEEIVGRKLDFIVQEMNREINTIGSKGNDLLITESVVKLKNELEKVREQVQNAE